ncbi:MAG: hypothetical protein KDB55_05225 [Mycobacterium sp.]|nr:hypothetical protein [Mycobacterium sp.]
MFEKPPTNPDRDAIADRAKHEYAQATLKLAAVQYRLAELAGTGHLDAAESLDLQRTLVDVWADLYGGTLCAVRDEDTDDSTWNQVDNTYSDGRSVMVCSRIEPEESAEFQWEHNAFLLDNGAVCEHPRGMICVIAPVDPSGDYITDDHQDTDFADLRRRLGRDDEEESQEDDGDVSGS